MNTMACARHVLHPPKGTVVAVDVAVVVAVVVVVAFVGGIESRAATNRRGG